MGPSEEERARRIFVFGSLNVDLVQRVARLPVPGETLAGDELQIFSGGKGANQACAAARLGGHVCMAGKVGNDAFGLRLKTELEQSGVDTTRVETSNRQTGAAVILVLPSGENVIVISPGANGTVTASDAAAALSEGQRGDILLCQLEIPIEATLAALHSARQRGMIGILDPAPASAIPDEALSVVTILIPNQTEAAGILGRVELEGESVDAPRELASELLRRGPEIVIIKLGSKGCLVARDGQITSFVGHRVRAVDTTAAGDTFSGGLAAELSRGEDLGTAVRFGNAAAALCVTKPGAISSIPTRAAVLEFLSGQ
ncbi:MAG: ribokinase [Bryobacteraceae bacterium]